MAVYTDITDSELAAFLADYDLGTLHAFKGIAEGVENSNFLVETDRARLILTLYERRVAETDLPFFIGLMSHLAQNGFPSPVPQTDRQGRNLKRLRDRPAALVSFLDGFSVREPLEVLHGFSPEAMECGFNRVINWLVQVIRVLHRKEMRLH